MTLEDNLHLVWKDDPDSFIIKGVYIHQSRVVYLLLVKCCCLIRLVSSRDHRNPAFICTSLLLCLLLGAVH